MKPKVLIVGTFHMESTTDMFKKEVEYADEYLDMK